MGFSENPVMEQAGDADNIFSGAEAFFAIVVAVVAGDGYLCGEKLEDIIRVIHRMKLFRKQSSLDRDVMVEKIFKFLQENGSLALAVKGTESIPGELRETAFAMSVDLAFADGRIKNEADGLIEQLKAGLGVTDQAMMKIIEVMGIKNRG